MRNEEQYRLLVAHNFLKNISLTGRHDDTALRMFNQEGLLAKPRERRFSATVIGTDEQPKAKTVTFEVLTKSFERVHIDFETGEASTSKRSSLTPERSNTNSVDRQTTVAEQYCPSSVDDDNESQPIIDVSKNGIVTEKSNNTPVNNELKPPILKPVVKQKTCFSKLIERLRPSGNVFEQCNQNLDGEIIPTPDSDMPSIASKSDLTLLNSLKRMNMKNDRVCFVSPITATPLVTFTNMRVFDKSDKRQRHQSSTSSETLGLRPFELDSDEEVSYAHLIRPSLTRYADTYSISDNSTRRLHDSDDQYQNKFKSMVAQSSGTALRIGQSRTMNSVDDVYKESTFSSEQHMNGIESRANAHLDDLACDAQNAMHAYDVALLNNAEFGAAHHKTTLRFTCYVTSIVDYVDRSELKKEINEKFRTRFPHIQLTYSKLQSIKREMRQICEVAGIDTMTLASAYVYYEKMVLRGMINKTNRKVVAAICLVLAAKIAADLRGDALKDLILTAETKFRANSKDIMQYEFPVLVALDFALHIADSEALAQHALITQRA